MSAKDQLTIPDAARKDPESQEVARIWVANNAQHVTLQVGAWKDPFAWGILLADLARHLANAYEKSEGLNIDETVRRIRRGFDAELNSPTDTPTGSII
jgi:hypothetical protein